MKKTSLMVGMASGVGMSYLGYNLYKSMNKSKKKKKSNKN